VTSADPQVNAGCDRTCLAGSLCRAAVTVNSQRGRCEELLEKLYASVSLYPEIQRHLKLKYKSNPSAG